MDDPEFRRVVSLACHDLRTPLATINGFAKTLLRTGELAEREARFATMIDEAAMQMAELLDIVSLATRIVDGRYEPNRRVVDTLMLARSSDARILVEGVGEMIETDSGAVTGALAAFAVAAVRHGGLPSVTWTVKGRKLALSPVTPESGPIVSGESPRDLGTVVGRSVIEYLDGSVSLVGEALHVAL